MQNWILVFHLFGLVLWAGSLLSLTRFMGWRSSLTATSGDDLHRFEKKLMFGGAHAGMGIVLLTGFWMLMQQAWGPLIPSVSGGGFHIKLTFVFLLIVVTFVAQVRVMRTKDNSAQQSSGQPKLLSALTLVAVIGALVAVYVFYPQMKAKKAAEPPVPAAVSADTAS